jgi:hypothetical protein
VFAQWIQLYQIDLDLVLSVLKAMSFHFSDFVLYATQNGDMIIVAKGDGFLSRVDSWIFNNPNVAETLKWIHIESLQDIEIRKIGNKKFLNRLLEASPVRANSDYYPVLDQNAARARFLDTDAYALHDFSHEPLPTMDLFSGGDAIGREETKVTPTRDLSKTQLAYTAMGLRDFFLHGGFDERYRDVPDVIRKEAFQLQRQYHECGSVPDESDRITVLFNTAVAMTPYLSPKELDAIWKNIESGSCASSLTPSEKNWILLFKAVGKRDPEGMVVAAKTLLRSGEFRETMSMKYLVACGMTGSLAQGNKEEALLFWTAYGRVILEAGPPDLLFRFLLANSTLP